MEGAREGYTREEFKRRGYGDDSIWYLILEV